MGTAKLALSPYSVLGIWVNLGWTSSLNSLLQKVPKKLLEVMIVRN